ncbi:MAG: thermonuclease family protein [Devosia sp.]|nr:thermonuclease family protein [Devosia sp.]
MTPPLSRLLVAALTVTMLGLPAAALAQTADTLTGDTLTGDASAIGPDIITIGTQRVVLLGIDAPEANQTCGDNSNIWKCADTAFAVLDQTVKGGPVTCTLKGTPDPFGKRNGVCTVGGKDVARELVKQGLAVIYPHDPESRDYAADQQAAKNAKQGLWGDGITFVNPWEYRIKHNHTPFK